MRVALCVPWRPTPSRLRHFETVVAQYPKFEMFTADSGREPFSVAASRNQAVRLASECDVVVVSDADLIYHGDLSAIIERAYSDGRVHLAYSECRGLTRAGTIQWYAGVDYRRCQSAFISGSSCGGLIVATPDAYLNVSQDERFSGWGYEDVDFAVRADLVREQGVILALWHEPASRASSDDNLELLNQLHPGNLPL